MYESAVTGGNQRDMDRAKAQKKAAAQKSMLFPPDLQFNLKRLIALFSFGYDRGTKGEQYLACQAEREIGTHSDAAALQAKQKKKDEERATQASSSASTSK
ncbi:hypothetical protein FRC17_007424 [Serendipita sp. 399]|nr:hypothetical protein FRC17_007424 [Serendipita sp. 399]